jgi:hypothetical protein
LYYRLFFIIIYNEERLSPCTLPPAGLAGTETAPLSLLAASVSPPLAQHPVGTNTIVLDRIWGLHPE